MTAIPNRSHIQTEQLNPLSANLDQLPILDAITLMNQQDAQVVAAVAQQKAAIATAIQWVADAFTRDGRLIYFGAGTSGRLAVLDASECPPTFCSDPAMIVGIIAGGDPALKKRLENVEDNVAAGAQAVRDKAMTAHDIAFGISAGGTTPFVHGALREAHARGCKTIFLICTDPAHVHIEPLQTAGPQIPDLFIPIQTGPEILTGSTRLKAGTATKLVLNMLTTLAMVQIGKTHGNLMIDIDAMKNKKLIDRALRILTQLTPLTRDQALTQLHAAKGKVKRALVMHARHCSLEEADRLLETTAGRLRPLL